MNVFIVIYKYKLTNSIGIYIIHSVYSIEYNIYMLLGSIIRIQKKVRGLLTQW